MHLLKLSCLCCFLCDLQFPLDTEAKTAGEDAVTFSDPSIADLHSEPALLTWVFIQVQRLEMPGLSLVLGQWLWLAVCTLGAARICAAESKRTHSITRPFLGSCCLQKCNKLPSALVHRMLLFGLVLLFETLSSMLVPYWNRIPPFMRGCLAEERDRSDTELCMVLVRYLT